MTDLTTLTHDELKEHGQAWFAEVESRLQTAGRTRALRLVKSAHAALNVSAAMLVDDGEITPLSGGTDKPDELP